MSHPLEQRFAALRTRLRRLVTLYGLSWIVGVGLTAALVLGLADYLIRFEDRGLRVMATLGLWAALAWTAYHYLYRALTARLRDVELARRVQVRFPALGDELASAVEFLRQPEDDPRAGSLALRRAVITQATARTERLDFEKAIEPRPTWRVGLVAIAITLVVLIVVVLDPLASRIAVARLVNPFSDATWPQATHLALRQPVERVARGQAFEVEVIDAQEARLPSEVRILYRFENPEGESAGVESESMRFIGGAMVARRENITRPFSFRVEGGDDHSMPWRRVEVVDAPAINSLAVRLVPPAYTGWPAEQSDGNIRALVGTQVEIAARINKPLAAAVLCLDGGRQVPARLADDGLSFTIPASAGFVVEKSGSYRFRLTDQEEMTGGDNARWEIRAVPDAPPTAVIEQPGASLFVTPRAVVPVRVLAKDDLAIHRIDLEFARSDRAEASDGWRKSDGEKKADAMLPIYTGPAKVEPKPGGLAAASGTSESRTVRYEWQLEGLGLNPGTQVTFWATATDYRPQSGKSEPRHLSIITPEELAERIAARQSTVLSELTRVLEMQRESRRQVTALQTRAREAAPLGQVELDHLRGAELGQRRVMQTLTSRTEGVPLHILALLADLENNKIDSPDVQRRMEQILAEIERLSREELPIIARELTAAIKAVEVRLEPAREAKPAQTDPAVSNSLGTAGGNQDKVIASLERMLDELGRWDSFRRFHRDVAQLLRDQEELSKQTADVGRRTLTKEVKDLSPQDVADLADRARGQLDLALRLERIEQGMEQAIEQLRASDAMASQTVADALARSRELGISGRMRSTGAQVERNQMGQALGQQRQIEQNLRELLEILANRRENELARLVKKFQETQQNLQQVAQREGELQKQAEQAAEQSKSDPEQAKRELQRLAAEQKKLQQQTEQLAKQMQQMQAQQATQSTLEAAQKMGEAGQCCGQGDCQGACQGAGEAKKRLDEAQRQLAEERREAEAQLAQEQLARIQESLKSLHGRQENALKESRRLAQLQQSQQSLTPAQEASLNDLAREQRLLQTETVTLGETIPGAEVFTLALTSAAREMSLAAGLLTRRETGAPTQAAQQNALTRLAQTLEALKPEPPEQKPEEKENDGQGGQGGQGGPKGPEPQGSGIPDLAQVKLLKLLQEDINRRTQELERVLGRGGPAANEARRQIRALSTEQGRLAELIAAMLHPQEAPKDDIDSLLDTPPNDDRGPSPPAEKENPKEELP